ncbi:MAG: hypothetical protein KAX44_08580, partial [Candidatus Brocadiae bacterium]|nr:hypothetical protein [Candidatus Brocadiia bacterium]
RAMAKDPTDRYQSYEDLIADLDALLSGEQVADSGLVPAYEAAHEGDVAAIEAALLEEVEKAPLQAPSPVDPNKLGATAENVQAKVAGVLALLAYVFLLACVHQLVLTRAGLAAGVALTAAMLLIMSGSSLSVLRRSSQGAAGRASSPVEDQLYRALEPLCERLAVPTPRLYISPRQRSDWYVYSFSGLKGCIDVPGGWLSRANLTDEETEALAAQSLGSLYSSDSGIRLLLSGPVALLRIGRWAAAGLWDRLPWLDPPLRRQLVDGAALAAMAGILAVLGLLAWSSPWGGVMGLAFVALLLLVAWFERSSRHAADAFATELMGSSDAVKSLVAVSGLQESEYDKLQHDLSRQAVAGESTLEPQQNEALLTADGIVSRYSETRYRPGLCARIRAFCSPVPCSAERINRLAGVAQTRLPAARTVAAAKRVLAGLAGSPEERTVTIRELAAVESHKAGGAVAGVVAVALLMFLSLYGAPAYAAFLTVTVLFACGLGVQVAARASGGVISPGSFGWRIVVAAVFFTCASMVAICLVGGRNLSYLACVMPLSVVPISLMAAISGALCVRLSRLRQTRAQS